MLFKDKLKKFRTDNSITQEELAEKLFVSRTLISKWENGVIYPSSENMKKLAILMNVEIDYLLSAEEAKMLTLDTSSRNEISTAQKILYIISLILFVAGMTLLIVGLVFPRDLTRPSDIYNSVNTITVICFVIKLLGMIMSIIGALIFAITTFLKRKS
ncbi:MAG: helix-turn-helix transcriptional regulator [Clostridia bacterium]|nr:helix-turn-helix transcriptional regulator [Clostridia bacterium]